MSKRPFDKLFMERALSLARKGEDRVSPNPMVGCVLVKDTRIVGRGFHARFGGPHAEVTALRQAGRKAKGATAYINLEPCCYHGKTPPCTDALIKAGVKRVVVSMLDPNPRVSGKGMRILRKAGIKTEVGPLKEKAQDLNRAFVSLATKRRPYVILKAAASLDGRIMTSTGDSRWITSPAARENGHILRSRADAILVGINTVLKDNPELTSHGKGKDPIRIVLDSDLRIPANARVLEPGAMTVIATSTKDFLKVSRLKGAARKARAAARHAPPVLQTSLSTAKGLRLHSSSASGGGRGTWGAGSESETPTPEASETLIRGDAPNHLCILRINRKKGRVDLKSLLSRLARMGVASLLVEGGSETHTSFLAQKLVDEVWLFIAPTLIGGMSAKSFFEGEGFRDLRHAIRLRECRVEKVGKDFLFRGRL